MRALGEAFCKQKELRHATGEQAPRWLSLSCELYSKTRCVFEGESNRQGVIRTCYAEPCYSQTRNKQKRQDGLSQYSTVLTSSRPWEIHFLAEMRFAYALVSKLPRLRLASELYSKTRCVFEGGSNRQGA